ncbi:MAG: thioredoxin family protein [Vampirovibrionales bacterium]
MVLLTALVAGCQPQSQESQASVAQAYQNAPEASQPKAFSPMAFGMIRPVKPQELLQLLPQVSQKPVLLVFKTYYCHDCQRMDSFWKPLAKQFKSVQVVLVDAQRDRTKYEALLRAYRPSVVPMMLAIRQGGELHNVLVGYQSYESLVGLCQSL